MSMNRRSLITGLISLVAAPAIVRVGSLMPVKVMADFDADTLMVKLIEWGLQDMQNWEINLPYVIREVAGKIGVEHMCVEDIYR